MDFVDVFESVKNQNVDEDEMAATLRYHLIGNGNVLSCLDGVNPKRSIKETFSSYVNRSLWSGPRIEARYRCKHSACAYGESTANCKIAVFGGAIEKGNLKDVQECDIINETWTSMLARCEVNLVPTPRTHHSTVYLSTNVWIKMSILGDIPKPRLDFAITR